jgi:hypothetical protein
MVPENGTSRRSLAGSMGVRSVWKCLHHVGQAMAGGDRLVTTMRGVIVSHEIWIGGEPKCMHADKRPAIRRQDLVAHRWRWGTNRPSAPADGRSN